MRVYEPGCADDLPHVIVVGPPGTGKTTTALRDFLEPALLYEMPERVLACSFSNAAANELRQRLAKALGVNEALLRETCSTIHGEALRRVRVSDPEVKLYDAATDSVRTFKRDSAPDSVNASETGEAAEQAWAMARALLVHDDEQQVRGWCKHFAWRAKTTGEALYDRIQYIEQRKRDEGALDFTDMLLQALRCPPRVSGFGLLLVDEVQDCTPLQWALIDHWAEAAQRVVLIGDPDQCIHEWAGATYGQLVRRVRSPDWQPFVLSQSYRVPVRAHALAREIIAEVVDREDAPYAPASETGEITRGGWEEMLSAAERIVDDHVGADEVLHADGSVTTTGSREMFILVRTNREVHATIKALKRRGIPFASEEPGETQPHAPAAARRARCLFDLFDGKRVAVEVVKDALGKLPAKEWFDGVRKHRLDSLPESGSVGLGDMPWLRAGTSALTAICAAGLDEWMYRAAMKWGAWVLESPPPLRVMTMHRSKGREADLVAVCGERANMAADITDEEVRLAYVAVTRTKRDLLVFARGGAIRNGLFYLEPEEVPF